MADHTLIRMTREPGLYPEPHAADVHPSEVESYRAGGWDDAREMAQEAPQAPEATLTPEIPESAPVAAPADDLTPSPPEADAAPLEMTRTEVFAALDALGVSYETRSSTAKLIAQLHRAQAG